MSHVNGADPRALLEAIQSSAAQVLTSIEDLPVAEVLSPSQVNQYLTCPARWGYKYISRLPEFRSGSLVRGTAVHRLTEMYYLLKMKLRAPQDTAAFVAEAIDGIWEEGCIDAAFAIDENPEELRAQTAELSAMYLTRVAPKIQPARIEQRVTGVIAGVPIQGYLDLLDASGTIHDTKTAARRPSGVTSGYALQVATYAQITPECGGLVQLTTLVATHSPQVIETPYEVSNADIRLTEQVYPAVQAAMQQGRVLPNRESNLCSRKYCSFWAQCEKDWGGTVKGQGEE
jgi:putative RecB family exonuclease